MTDTTYEARVDALDAERRELFDRLQGMDPKDDGYWTLVDQEQALGFRIADLCRCGREGAEERLDARGIYLAKCCDSCWAEKRKGYRPDVLTDPNYWADEPIEPDGPRAFSDRKSVV